MLFHEKYSIRILALCVEFPEVPLTKMAASFFQYLHDRDKANSIRSMRSINDEVRKIKKEKLKELKTMKDDISQEEYVSRFDQINDWSEKLYKNNIEMATANNDAAKQLALERRPPLQIASPPDTD
jgi:type II secretory pathway component HofQ